MSLYVALREEKKQFAANLTFAREQSHISFDMLNSPCMASVLLNIQPEHPGPLNASKSKPQTPNSETSQTGFVFGVFICVFVHPLVRSI